MEKEIITPHSELMQFIKDGLFFNFCIAFALNKGFKDALKQKKKVEFMVGDYKVTFDAKFACFTFAHQTYFARIITTYYTGETIFIGDNEKEVINEVLTEFKKETK